MNNHTENWLEDVVQYVAQHGELPKPRNDEEAMALDFYGGEIKKEANILREYV